MNGPHDLGGQMGFGPIALESGAPEPNEPWFHAEWEKRALGLTLCSGALRKWTIDESRHARESLPPAIYYSASYYEIWMRALETLLLRHAIVTPDELASGRANASPVATPPLMADRVPAMLARGGPCDRPLDAAPAFAAGQRVRARNIHPTHHTRLPRYVRGHVGAIEAARGAFVFPDTNAHEQGEAPQHLYTVVFSARDLWGEDADPTLSVSIDAWESYLEPV